MNEKTKQFIKQHSKDDVHQLSLQAKRYPDIDIALAAQQIAGSQKTENKIPLFFQTENILYPVRLSLEQASSEITARYKATLCKGKTFIDLTGGFGIDCFFISRNFEQAFYVEKQKELCEIAKHNFDTLNAKNIAVINTDAESYLNDVDKIACIYLDPARRNNNGKKLMLLADCEPNVQKLAPDLKQKAEQVLIKLSPMLDISTATNEISGIDEIHIVAVENECKEILLLLQKQKIDEIKVRTINFLKNGTKQIFEYKLNSETKATVKYATEIKQYLYEPNSAIMKSGAFKLISEYFDIEKLHINTHLYTSDKCILEFPGRIFEVVNIGGNSKNELKKLSENINKANITVRNYPLSAIELRKKLKLSDGGNCYLFGCTLANNEKKIVECRKIVSIHFL